MSERAARDAYGVVVGDAAATARERAAMRRGRGEPEFFDRGPGYQRLAAGG